VLALAIGALCFYLANAAVHAFVFKDHSFLEEISFSTGNPEDVFHHALVLVEFAIFGLFFYRIFVKRNQAEEKLRESEQRWATTLASIGDAVIETNTTGEITFLNAEAEKLTGWTLSEASHKPLKNVFKIMNESTRQEVDNPIAKVLETGSVVGLANHTVLLRKDGTEVFIDDSAAPIRIRNSKIRGVVIVFRDISTRRKAEQELRDLKEFNESIVESIAEILLVIDPEDYRIIAANGEAGRELKLRKEDLIGQTCYKATHNSSTPCKDPHSCPMREALVTGKVATAEHVHFDKKQNKIDVEISVYPVKNQKGEITKVVHIARNVTERKKTEELLRETKEYLDNLLNYANAPIIVWDNEHKINLFNSAFEALTGYSKESMLGKKIDKLFPPSQKSEILQTIEKATRGEKWLSVEVPILCKNEETKIALWNSANIQDKGGNTVATIAQGQDITDRKKAEEALDRTMDELVLVNEKLNVVGSLTRHDVRNKLCTVTGNAYLLKKKHSDQADILEGLGKMELAVKEIEKIFDFAKMYEQLGVEELSFVDVERTVTEAVALFSDLTVKVVNECKGLTLLADSFLRQLFYNFIDNTRKYGKKTTAIQVYFEKTEQGELRLIYEDNGVGISAENKLKLFSEGFSTGGSTGFGLFLIRKMIEVYGWEIKETGEPGKGAKFVMTIPKVNLNGKKNYKID
jgi:PAS domain S-box-containing protein